MSAPAREPMRLDTFKQLAADVAPAARAVCLAQANAELTRERVNAYIRPVFDSFTFKYGELCRGELSGRITNPDHLYLCGDDALVAEYFEACDVAHKAHGSKLPHGHCPALHAESLLMDTERAFIELTAPAFGLDPELLMYGPERRKWIDLMLGAALKADREARS